MSDNNRELPLVGTLTTKVRERVYKPVLVGAFCIFSITAFSNRYTFLPPVSDYPCIPGSLFLLDRHDQNIKPGDLVTFKSKGTKFPDGTLFTKITAGIGGDSVEINRGAVSNGTRSYHSDVSVTADHLQIPVDSLSKVVELPNGELFAIGTLPGTYDSRFWGSVNVEEQVVGRTYVIF